MAGLIHLVLKMLERSEAKVSRYVLRGVGRSNAAYLLGAPLVWILMNDYLALFIVSATSRHYILSI